MPDRVRVIHGDCMAVLPTLPADSVHAVVTDPPYALVSTTKRFGADDAAPAKSNGATGVYQRASSGFMGKTWDTGKVAFDPDLWREVLRVLKPGGHVLAFGGTRTYHRLACAVEDAGFEIRDAIMWHYGSGFPKSHDVSKGMDRRKDWSALHRLQVNVRTARKALGISQSEAARRCGLIPAGESLGGGGFMWFETGMRLPTREQYPRLKAALALGDDCDEAFEQAERTVIGQHADDTSPGGFGEHRFTFNNRDITAPATDAAREWQGWGTALKPATEIIVLARKPLGKSTVAANVLAFGVGALNIDGCRVEFAGTDDAAAAAAAAAVGFADSRARGTARQSNSIGKESRDGTNTYDPFALKGRWPANVLHDGSEEVLAAFPETQSGTTAAAHADNGKDRGILGAMNGRQRDHDFVGSQGSAARFFYTSKADAADRLQSKHPTVKPVDLIAYLCRLITPPGGTVLDCFAGSGTTGMACMREGFNAILIERELEYVTDARRRIAHVSGQDAPLFAGAAT